jgi:FkbM family methyltransferase
MTKADDRYDTRSALAVARKAISVLRTEGLGGVVSRIRRRWRLRMFRPHVLDKRYDNVRFRFLVGSPEGQEWYGKFVDNRLYKPMGRELAWLKRAVREGNWVADVGAHHGYFTVLLAHWVGSDGNVVAFECLPENAAIASYNARINRLGNVHIVAKAVGAKSGTVEIGTTSAGIRVERLAQPELIPVDLVSLDGFFDDRYPDLLKIDVEGYELDVLKGAKHCLARRPSIALEFHCFKYEEPRAEVQRILDLLPTEGYEFMLAPEAGEALVNFAIDEHAAAVIAKQYNPHLYATPVAQS